MGERTQLFIKIQDEDQNQIAGIVRHYQWGFGRVMLLDTLNLAANAPFISEINLDETQIPYVASEKGFSILDRLINDKHFEHPILAYEFNQYFNRLSNSVNNAMGKLSHDFDNYVPHSDIFKDIDLDNTYQINDTLNQLNDKYNDKIDQYYKYCDNDDGFAELTITYNGEGEAIDYPNKLELKLFNHTRDPLSLHEYCQLAPTYTAPDFETGFALLAKSYNISLEK